MFDDFAYRTYRVRAGVCQRGRDGQGRWFGVISLVNGGDESLLCLSDHMFDWPASARRYAVRYAKSLIDARLDGNVSARPTTDAARGNLTPGRTSLSGSGAAA